MVSRFLFVLVFVAFAVAPVVVRAQDSSMSPPDFPDSTALPEDDGVVSRTPGLELESSTETGKVPESMASVKNREILRQYEQKQEQKLRIEKEIREDAFAAAIRGLMPLEPDEIRELLEHYDKAQEAVKLPVYPYPEPKIVVKTVSLDPGAVPVLIKTAVGHVTTLNILDATGALWKISSYTWAGDFEILEPDTENPELLRNHALDIIPTSEFAHGNIILRLAGLDTPVLFTIESHRDEVYYRMDARVAALGPGAKTPLIGGMAKFDSGLVAGDNIISTILDGAPPDSAVRMEVKGVDGRTTAYSFNGMTYVRSPLALLSPAWTGSASSADGMNVYALAEAPVVLLSDSGRIVRAHLSKKEE